MSFCYFTRNKQDAGKPRNMSSRLEEKKSPKRRNNPEASGTISFIPHPYHATILSSLIN